MAKSPHELALEQLFLKILGLSKALKMKLSEDALEGLSFAEKMQLIRKIWRQVNAKMKKRLQALRRHDQATHQDMQDFRAMTQQYLNALKAVIEQRKVTGHHEGLFALFFSLKTLGTLPTRKRYISGGVGASIGAALALSSAYFLGLGLISTFGLTLAVTLFSYYFSAHCVAVAMAYREGQEEVRNAVAEILSESALLNASPEKSLELKFKDESIRAMLREEMEFDLAQSRNYCPLRDATSMKLKFQSAAAPELDDELNVSHSCQM